MRIKQKFLKALLLLLVLAAALHVAAATNATAPLLLDGIAAEVGEARITIAETMLLAREMAAARKLSAADQAAGLRALYAEARERLVARQLILQTYALAEQKLPGWAVDRRVSAVIDEHFDGDRSRLVSMLNKQGLGFDEWRKRLEEEMVIATMRQQFVDQQVIVAPAEVRAYYATNAVAFAAEGPVRVGMILVGKRSGEAAGETVQRARGVRERLCGGHDFRAVARAESAEAHAPQGGDWGYVDPDEVFRKEIAAALAGIKVGEISDLIETESGVYLVTKFDERADGVMPLEAAWTEIEAHLRRLKAEARYQAWIASLKQNTSVRVFPLP
jgi:peptidyl-prolyl cis-trans isomerase SurA